MQNMECPLVICGEGFSQSHTTFAGCSAGPSQSRFATALERTQLPASLTDGNLDTNRSETVRPSSW